MEENEEEKNYSVRYPKSQANSRKKERGA